MAAGLSESQGDDSLHTTPKNLKYSIYLLITHCITGGILISSEPSLATVSPEEHSLIIRDVPSDNLDQFRVYWMEHEKH